MTDQLRTVAAAEAEAEAVAEVADAAGDQWQRRFDQVLSETAADPGPLYPFIASALCVAYTEGKLR